MLLSLQKENLSSPKLKKDVTTLSVKQLETMYELCDSLDQALGEFAYKIAQSNLQNKTCPDPEENPKDLIICVKEKALMLVRFKKNLLRPDGKPQIGDDTSGIVGYLLKKGFSKKGKSTLRDYLKLAEVDK